MIILFKIYPQKSHLNATFPLARALQALGHEIIYAGVHELEGHVTAQGFSYHVQPSDVYAYLEDRPTDVKLTLWLAFRMWWKNRHWAAAMQARFGVDNPFAALIRTLKPDALLIDSPYTIFALSLFRYGIPFGIVESMMNVNRSPGSTPLDTTYVVQPTSVSRFVAWCHWRRYFIKRWMLGVLGFRADFDRTFVRMRARAAGVAESAIDFERYFHLGLNSVPEFILSPQALDLPRIPAPNQVYVGPSVLMDRSETASDYLFSAEFARLNAERSRGRPLVYCSLGTAGWRYQGGEAFLERVIASAERRPWNLIVAIGTKIDPNRFRRPANVAVFQVVPQLQVLHQSDLMITHGGMNSVTECVLLGVPMLVYPGTAQIDQAGNAARVVYHRLGLQGRLISESSRAIARKVEAILSDSSYSARIRTMADQITTSEPWANGAQRVLDRLARASPALGNPPLPTVFGRRDEAVAR